MFEEEHSAWRPIWLKMSFPRLKGILVPGTPIKKSATTIVETPAWTWWRHQYDLQCHKRQENKTSIRDIMSRSYLQYSSKRKNLKRINLTIAPRPTWAEKEPTTGVLTLCWTPAETPVPKPASWKIISPWMTDYADSKKTSCWRTTLLKSFQTIHHS